MQYIGIDLFFINIIIHYIVKIYLIIKILTYHLIFNYKNKYIYTLTLLLAIPSYKNPSSCIFSASSPTVLGTSTQLSQFTDHPREKGTE